MKMRKSEKKRNKEKERNNSLKTLKRDLEKEREEEMIILLYSVTPTLPTEPLVTARDNVLHVSK